MRKSALLVIMTMAFNLVLAQKHKLESVYIFSFTRHIIWPEDYNQGDFEIYVLGDSPIITELHDLEQKKKVNGRTIKVTQINAPSEIKKCNILFVSSSKSSQFPEVMAKVGGQSILTITEEPGLGARGSHINFVTKDSKLFFELNQNAANKNNLKISNTLTSMAILL